MNAAAGQIQGARRRQEDAWRIDRWGPRELLAIVADGLGGHPGGDIASTLAVAAFGEHFAAARDQAQGAAADWLGGALRTAHQALRSRQRTEPALRGMATTLVALYLREDRYWCISVGDSYLLRLRQSHIACLNELHSEMGGVTSCVGYNLAHIDLIEARAIEPGDRFLLASDGIATLNADALAASFGAAPDPDAAVTTLLRAVEDASIATQDNVTLVAAFA